MSMTAKLAISLPRQVLGEVDELAKLTHRSRSALILDALEQLLADYQERRSLQKAAVIYKAIAEEDENLNQKFLFVAEETLPSYEISKEKRRGSSTPKR